MTVKKYPSGNGEEREKLRMNLDTKTFAQKLREGVVVKNQVVHVSVQMWEIIVDRIAASVPQQHGACVWNPGGIDWGRGAWQCSLCGSRNSNLPVNNRVSPHTFSGSRYCPNCGARMDEKKGDH